MLKSYFKKVFGGDKEVPASEQFYSPLRIGLHSTVKINTVDWLVMQGMLNDSMVLPSSSLTVQAIGETKNDDDTIFQVYMADDKDEEFILQLYCADKGGKSVVTEATLYRQVVNIVPLTESDWSDNMETIGNPTIELDGNTYNRVWGAESAGKIDMMEFNETVIEASKTIEYVNNYLLYSREFESVVRAKEVEMLLVGVEETTFTAEITMMLGLPVPVQNINVQ